MLRLRFTFFRLFILLALIVVLAGASLSFIPKKTKAVFVSFYPSSCLGGWNNVHGAEGEPDGNSASVTDTIADIFCGKFTGEIPKDSVPTKFVLKLSWRFGQPEIREASSTNAEGRGDSSPAPSMTPDATAVQMNEAIVQFASTTGTSTTQATTTATSTGENQTISSPTPEATPSPSATPTPESTPTPTPTITPSPTETPMPTPAATTAPADIPSPQSFHFEFVKKALAEDSATTTASSSPEVSSSTPITTPFLSLDFTLDGTTWKHLAFISASQFQDTFELPAEDVASWNDVSNLQVRLSRLATLDSEPEVLLDGMTIQADYGPLPSVTPGNSDTKKFHVSGIVTALPIGVSVTDDADQGEQFMIGTLQPGTLHFYSKTDEAYSMTTGIGDGQLVLPTYSFPAGDYEAVLTGRGDGCDAMALDECKSDSSYLGHILFTIVPSTQATSTVQ